MSNCMMSDQEDSFVGIITARNASNIYEEDDFQCPDPFELHEKYQAFIKANGSRNTSLDDENKDELCEDVSRLISISSLSESDMRFCDVDVKELMECNKKYRQQNDDLQEKVERLLHQLEAAEDDHEQQKKEMFDLEKDLKNCRDMLRDQDNLVGEMEQLQMKFNAVSEGRLKAESHVKRLKSDEEELLITITSQRDKIDHLSKDTCSLAASNKNLYEENVSLKDRCESLQLDLEMKDKELEQKMQLYQAVREQAEDYKTSVQNLHEEKVLLLNQLREIQVEISMHQTCHRSSMDGAGFFAQSSPRKYPFSLQSEIAEAELGFQGCSTSSHSSNAEESAFESFSMPRSPRKSGGSILSSTHLCGPDTTESNTQTESGLQGNTASNNGISAHSAILSHAEECAGLKDKLSSSEEALSNLKEVLEHQKQKGQYLATQLGMKQTKTRELISLNQKYVTEITLLTDIIHKLGTSKLDVWYEEMLDTSPQSSGRENLVEGNERENISAIGENASELVDALAIEAFPKVGKKKDARFMLSRIQVAKDVDKFVRDAEEALQHSRRSIASRISILQKCKSMLKEAIARKMDSVKDLMRDLLYQRHSGSGDDENLQSAVNLTRDINDYLKAVCELMNRYGNYFEQIGVLETENRFHNIIEVFVDHIGNLKAVCYGLTSEMKFERDEDDFCLASCLSCSTAPDVVVDEISVALFQSVALPRFTSAWGKKLLEDKRTAELLHVVVPWCYKLQNFVPNFNRTTLFLLIFLACSCISTSRVDYRVEPIF